MSFFKFTPDLMTAEELSAITVGRAGLIEDIIQKLDTAAAKGVNVYLVLIGPRGIGKTHTLLTIYRHFQNSNNILPIRLSEEEYSVTTVVDLFKRMLEVLNVTYEGSDIEGETIKYLKSVKANGRLPLLIVDNLQMLFEQIRLELPKLRSILQTHNLFSILSSALTNFSDIASYDEPFYNFFEPRFLRGLNEAEVTALIQKRLEFAGKPEMAKALLGFRDRITGIQILTGGNPRLIHSLSEILIQQSNFEEIERNLLQLLDQLTPYYQSRMEMLSTDNRKIIDLLSLADGPLSATELATILNKKPSILVTQLHRLEKDGFVESIRFREKKEIRYQVAERLYRIWREMRSPAGKERVSLLVDFLRVWFSPIELFEQHKNIGQHFDNLVLSSREDSKKLAKQMCYISEAIGRVGIFNLRQNIDNLLKVGDIKAAQNEIERVKHLVAKESDVVVKAVSELQILFSEIDVYEATKQNTEYAQAKSKIDQKSIQLKDLMTYSGLKPESLTLWLHEAFHQLAYNEEFEGNYVRAKEFIDLSLETVKNNCDSAKGLKAQILLRSGKATEALPLIQEVVSRTNRVDDLVTRMKAYSTVNDEENAIKDAREVVKRAPLKLDETFTVFGKFGKIGEFKDILAKSMPEFSALPPNKKSELVISLADNIVHYAGHFIQDKDMKNAKYLLEMLEMIRPMMIKENVLEFMIPNLRRFAPEDPETVATILQHVQLSLGADYLEALKPVIAALEFIRTKDTDILEKLHKETRELVIDIIAQIGPKIDIPKEVRDSVKT